MNPWVVWPLIMRGVEWLWDLRLPEPVRRLLHGAGIVGLLGWSGLMGVWIATDAWGPNAPLWAEIELWVIGLGPLLVVFFWTRQSRRKVDPDEFAQALLTKSVDGQSVPDELAQVLLTEFVDGQSVPDVAEVIFKFSPGKRYLAQTRLYRVALVLSVLLEAEQSDARWLAVRTSFERLIFTMPQEEGMPFLEDLRTAMQSFEELLTVSETGNQAARAVRWAMAWFQAIGMDESNPALLTCFAGHWMDAYIMLSKLVREVRPA